LVSVSAATSAGAAIAARNSANPFSLMRTGPFSSSAASAARTAASRTKSVRERPRRAAARSITATSASGKRIDSG